MSKKYTIVFCDTYANKFVVEAENKDDAWKKAQNEIGNGNPKILKRELIDWSVEEVNEIEA